MCINQTSFDEGYIVAGYTESNDGDVTKNHGFIDYWVVKLDPFGEIMWEKSLGGSDAEAAYSIFETNDIEYVIAGETYSDDGDVSGNHGQGDYWVVKLNRAGEIEWQKCLGGSGQDVAESICGTDDDGYVVAGYTESNDGDVSGNHGEFDYWVVKLDSAGEIEWQKCFGGSSIDAAFTIIQTGDGGFIVAGGTESVDGDVTKNHGDVDYWVVKLDPFGEIVWEKSLGGTDFDAAYSICMNYNGEYVIAGDTYSDDGEVTGNHGQGDYWVVKLDPSGEIMWEKCLGGTETDVVNSIVRTVYGSCIVTGYTESNDGDVTGNHGEGDYWVVKLEQTGETTWEKCLGGSEDDDAFSIIQTIDVDGYIVAYIVAGSTGSVDGDVSGNHGENDYWVVKLSQSPVPVASFIASPTIGETPLTVRFTDTSTGYPTSWNWIFGDGLISSVRHPVHEYTDRGRYNVSLTVSNLGGYDSANTTICVMNPETELYLALDQGWNLVSVPRYPSASQETIGDLFGGVINSGHSIFMFNATTQSWDEPESSHPVTPLEAYYVYSTEQMGIMITYSNEQPAPEIVLMPMWNQMGFSGIQAEETSLYLSPLQDAWTFILGFDAVRQIYEETIIRGGTGPYSDARLMYPGKGYWLYSEEDIVFHPPS